MGYQNNIYVQNQINNNLYELYGDEISGKKKSNDTKKNKDPIIGDPEEYIGGGNSHSIEIAQSKAQRIDKIVNFNPSTDTLEIDAGIFETNSSATFASGKNKRAVKKKLSKKGFDFLYDEKSGSLYFNENGADKGFGDGGIIAILKGAPDLTANNLEFI